MGGLTGTGVASPCTGVCTLDADDLCIGCGRTLDEIAAWASMSADRQRAVIAALPSRGDQVVAGAGISASSIAPARL